MDKKAEKTFVLTISKASEGRSSNAASASRPKAENDTPEGRARGRRVELALN
jgi:outer membrane protein OmpA-like peptidoglycan-associated protein